MRISQLHDGASAGTCYAVSMKEPSPRSSRLVLAGSLAVALAVGSTGFVLGRRSVTPLQPTAPAPPSPVSAPTTSPRPSKGAELDRAGLLALAAQSADAIARGDPLPKAARDAVGTRFSLGIAFGCGGPLADGDDTRTGWRYDLTAQALRLQVAPVRWPLSYWWPQDAPVGLEAIEGFWIPRPWTGSETCPATTEPASVPGIEAVTLPGQTLGVAQVFTDASARSGQRDEPYTAVLRLQPEAVRTERGFRLRLSGRIAALPGGEVVRCRQPGGPEQRPVCLVAATFDEVSVENATTGETLASWPGGASTRTD